MKRSTTLADGRELIYFDDPDTSLGEERAVDSRTLDPRPETATMRLDVLTGDWISVAAARQNRAFLPPKELDPLAPQTPTNPSEIPARYDVAVFENRSPSFGPALPHPDNEPHGDALHAVPNPVPNAVPVAQDPPRGLDDLAVQGLGRTRTGVGRCEVVCFSPDSEGSFGTQTATRARTVIEAWADRTAALSALPGIQQVFPFENRGQAIGVTLGHPHGQIYAYPYITPRTQRLLDQIGRTSPDLFADILDFERRGPRMVLTGEHWSAFVPFAARWPMEVHLLPHRHVADFADTTDAERDELAPMYLRLLRGVDALYGALPSPNNAGPSHQGPSEGLVSGSPTPYIAAWHQAPVRAGRDSIRLHLELTSPRRAVDKLKYLAGSEAAMGAWIADIAPETAAVRLRAAIEKVTL